MTEDGSVDEFEAMIADSMDRLPEEFQALLEKVPVIVSDQGVEANAYGQYYGDGLADEPLRPPRQRAQTLIGTGSDLGYPVREDDRTDHHRRRSEGGSERDRQ